MGTKTLILALLFLAWTSAFADKDEPASDNESRLQSAMERARITASELVVRALQFIGVNYRYGGKDPVTGFDCSGFVSHVFQEAAGVTLPHNAYRMAMMGQTIRTSDLQPGDLVFYKTMRRAFSHVGIYLGDNKFIHAPSTGKTVEVSDMNDAYWAKRFEGARRVAELAALPQIEQPLPAETQPGVQDQTSVIRSLF